MLHSLSETYRAVAERITGQPLVVPPDPRESMMSVLQDQFALVN